MSIPKPQKSPSNSEYRKVLTKILGVVRENTDILDNHAYINLFSICTDQIDNEHDFYGIKKDEKGKIVFCFSSGHSNSEWTGCPLNMSELAKRLELYRTYPTVNPIILKQNFLTNIAAPLRRYEMLNAGIELKVQRKLRKLEQALE